MKAVVVHEAFSLAGLAYKKGDEITNEAEVRKVMTSKPHHVHQLPYDATPAKAEPKAEPKPEAQAVQKAPGN